MPLFGWICHKLDGSVIKICMCINLYNHKNQPWGTSSHAVGERFKGFPKKGSFFPVSKKTSGTDTIRYCSFKLWLQQAVLFPHLFSIFGIWVKIFDHLKFQNNIFNWNSSTKTDGCVMRKGPFSCLKQQG